MEEKDCLQNFVKRVITRPHIAENIIKRLDITDVARCLTTSKDFRHFIVSALAENPKLHYELDLRLSMLIVTSGRLDITQYGPIKAAPSRNSTQEVEESFGFALDGSLWLSTHRPVSDQLVDHGDHVSGEWDEHVFSIYDLQRSINVTKIMAKYHGRRPKIRLLPFNKVMMKDRKGLRVFSKSPDGKAFDLLSSCAANGPIQIESKHFTGNDSIYKIEKIKRDGLHVVNMKMFFWDDTRNLVIDRNLTIHDDSLHTSQVFHKVREAEILKSLEYVKYFLCTLLSSICD